MKGLTIMKPNKLLSFVLSLAVSSSLTVIPVSAEETQNITAYLSVSRYGEFVSDKDGNKATLVPVELTGETSYTLDDVFTAAHDLYYDGGADAGYASADSNWGLSLATLWGDSSGNVGYYVNGASPSDLTCEIVNGDCIDAFIYTSGFYEAYSKFGAYSSDAVINEPTEFTLYQAGYDANWNMIFSPCADATITINDEETDITTDENGVATLTFDSLGTYTISATKTKIVDDETVPAITAPVCKVSVVSEIAETEEPTESPSENPSESPTETPSGAPVITADTVINNIAKKLSENGVATDGNMQWFVADMAMYAEVYPESEFVLSDTEKQLCLNVIIEDAEAATAPAALAKDIIALRALGYDARNIYTADEEQLDAVAKLTALVDEGSDAITNIYTLPYVIMALQQGTGYATDIQMNSLIETAVANKSSWHDTTRGIDGITPMIVALAPYYRTNDSVKTAINEAVEIIGTFGDETGLINNPATTALAITAYSALGTDVETLTTDATLIDGLLTQVSETGDGFVPVTNSFSTEQGFRGLLAWKLLDNSKRMFDFSSYPMNAAHATDETPTAAPTDKPSGDDGGSSSDNDITVSVRVMMHDEDKCDNSYTYKNNSSKYTAIVNESFTMAKGSTVYDALIYALNKNKIEYEVDKTGYLESINGVAEFDHGNKSGWQFMINGNYIDSGSKEIELNSSGSITWFYTDDYTKEKGSDRYSAGSGSSSSNIKATAAPTETPTESPSEAATESPAKETLVFTDVSADAWYSKAVNYVVENGLFDGVTDTEFEPDTNMTRAMLVTVLYRFENTALTASETAFTDITKDTWYYDAVQWASANKIVDGITDTEFSPDTPVTREQIATIIYRYAQYRDMDVSVGEDTNILSYDDAFDISEYAIPAIQWACGTGIINGTSDSELSPAATATRAQVAAILMRFIESAK